jgi:hypothetical protein
VARRAVASGRGRRRSERHPDNKVAVTIGSETRFFDVPENKDVDMDGIVELRRLLTAAGYGGGAG